LKIDVSTVLLVILCIIPGLFAQRSRNLVFPRSFVEQGASAELGELVALGVSTHGLLVLIGSLLLLILGFCHCIQPLHFFHSIDAWPIRQWSSLHPTEAVALGTCYVFLSFAVSHWLGLAYGIWRGKAPITTRALKNATWLQKWGVTGLLGEKPIIYEILSPNVAEDGTECTVFVELEMKDQLGFYAGQLSQFAIVKDEEPHKPIYLIDASYRRTLADDYVLLQGDGVLLDLADAAQVFVKQVAPLADGTDWAG
jgi:hypothetical protein